MPNRINEDELRAWIDKKIVDLPMNFGGHASPLSRLANRHADTTDAVRSARRLRGSDPDWARRCRERGEPLHRFWPDDVWELETDIETAAEQIVKLEELRSRTPRKDAGLRADRLLRGLAKRSLNQFMREATAVLGAAETADLKARRNEKLCSRKPLKLAKGVWAYRAETLASLDRIGREADNCLKGSGEHARRYQERLLAREIDIWEVRGKQRSGSSLLRAVVAVDIKNGVIEEMEEPGGSEVAVRYGQAIETFVRRLGLGTKLGLTVKGDDVSVDLDDEVVL